MDPLRDILRDSHGTAQGFSEDSLRTPCLGVPYKGSLRDFLRGPLRTPIRTPLKDSLRAPLTIVRRRIRILPLEFYENLLDYSKLFAKRCSKGLPMGSCKEFSKGLC